MRNSDRFMDVDCCGKPRLVFWGMIKITLDGIDCAIVVLGRLYNRWFGYTRQ
jgi:hypothetical protein